MRLDSWFLTTEERGNPATRIDDRHGGVAWSTGNEVQPLIHGATYFDELLRAVRGLRRGDLLMFTDWRGDPDEKLDGPGTEVSRVFSQAAERGVIVKGLLWRSHLGKLQFSAEENRHLGDEIEAAGGECLLDMRVRMGGSHHQKLIVLRHPGRSELDVAYVGGIDLSRSRRDDARHHGDEKSQTMSEVYGDRPAWHDIQVAIRGPGVGDVEATFRERWDDPTPLTRNPARRVRDLLQHEDTKADPLPPQLPDPPERGTKAVQLVRTYPYRGRRGYPFAPQGERSIAHAYHKAVGRARRLIYLEDQYFWSKEVTVTFARALARNPDLRMIVVVPLYPDADGKLSMPPNLVGRVQAMRLLGRAGGDRVAFYGPENHEGTPVYVHAKACVIDDTWTEVGSDNVNRRSWTHDSELSCAVLDETTDPREPLDPGGMGDGARVYPRELRLALAREHLDRKNDDDADLLDPRSAFDAFARSAGELDAWHRGGRVGERPPGRLRRYPIPQLSRWTMTWAEPSYRLIYDPDGRPRSLRRAHRF